MNDFKTIEYEINNSIAKITLNRPKAFNSFTPLMNKEIIKALKAANKDNSVRCVIITGAGKAFCAGEDVGNVDSETNHSTFLKERYHPMIHALNAVEKPVIAAVNGVAAGAGMSLSLATDFRLVKEETKFISAFMNIGLIPDSGLMYTLPRILGYAKALEITTLGKAISGQEAVQLGLATELIEAENWDKRVNEFASELAQMPTKAFALVKRYMLDSMHNTFEDALEKEASAQRIAGLTSDHKEGIASFKEKRTPKFTGN